MATVDVVAPRKVWRLLGPAGFALVFAGLWLPFLVAPPPSSLVSTVAPSVTYTGFDLAFGGTADVFGPQWQPDGRSYRSVPISDQEMYGHPQPPLAGSVYGIVAVVLIGIGVLTGLIPVRRIRGLVGGSAALVGALALLALEVAQRRSVAQLLPQLLGPLLGLPPDGPAPVQLVSVRLGFLIPMALLVVIGFVQIGVAVPVRRSPVAGLATLPAHHP